MKFLKHILLIFFLLIIFLLGALLVIAFSYENEVKNYFIGELNKQLKTEVRVAGKDISLSLFKNFPYASLSFKNVVIMESPIASEKKGKNGTVIILRKDTLLSALELGFQFNVLDILSKHYTVKKIYAEDGKIKLRKAKNGSVNWDVWKEDSLSNSSTTQESVFGLEKLSLKNIAFLFRDYASRSNISAHVNNGTISGELDRKSVV